MRPLYHLYINFQDSKYESVFFFFFLSSLTSFVKVDWQWTLLERSRDLDTNKNNRTSIIFLIRWKRGLTENERSSKWETCNWFIVPNNLFKICHFHANFDDEIKMPKYCRQKGAPNYWICWKAMPSHIGN